MIRNAMVAYTIFVLLVSPTRAQTVQVDLQGVARSEGLGRAFQTFSVFGGTPGIAAAQYQSDFNLSNYQLPITHTFSNWNDPGVAPYVEITLGYLNAQGTFPLEGDASSPKSARISFNSWSALTGLGIEVQLGNDMRIRPILLAGYAHFNADTNFSGPNASVIATAVKGILTDAALNTALLGGALEIVYEKKFRGDFLVTVRMRYNELEAVVTSATNPSLKQDGSFGVATGGINVSGPTDWHIANRSIRWLGYTNGTWFPNTDRSTLGFNAFAEIGGGVQLLAPDVVRGVQGGTLRASAIVGPGVTGWLVSAALDF
jgi:hypothetical protein